jgi:hypothetical protein
MQSIELGFALIRERGETGSTWLTLASRNQAMVSFISGTRLEGESFRETVTREVAWQLDLERDREFLVANMAQIDLEFEGTVPGQSGPTRLHVAFYSVDLYRRVARSKVASRTDLVWVPSSTLCQAPRFGEWLINPFHQSLIQRSKVIESWH